MLDGSLLLGGTFRDRSSSPCNSVGDTAADEPESSASDTSSEAAKLLEISGSEETKAYEDWVEAVDVVEIVLSLVESREEAWRSSCQTELAVTTVL